MPANQPLKVDVGRFPRAAVLTIFTSVVTVQLIRALAVVVLHPSARFEPLTLFPPFFDTVFGAGGAIFVFYQIAQYAADPVRTYRNVAAVVLLISFAPDIALALSHAPGAGWPEASALMLMHVAVWALCVTMLPRLVATKDGKTLKQLDENT